MGRQTCQWIFKTVTSFPNMILNIDAFDEFESSVLFSDGPASAAFFASYELIQRWMSGPER